MNDILSEIVNEALTFSDKTTFPKYLKISNKYRSKISNNNFTSAKIFIAHHHKIFFAHHDVPTITKSLSLSNPK
jgi:hypothetical protein